MTPRAPSSQPEWFCVSRWEPASILRPVAREKPTTLPMPSMVGSSPACAMHFTGYWIARLRTMTRLGSWATLGIATQGGFDGIRGHQLLGRAGRRGGGVARGSRLVQGPVHAMDGRGGEDAGRSLRTGR